MTGPRGIGLTLGAAALAIGAAMIAPPLLAQDQGADTDSVTVPDARPVPKPDAPLDSDRPLATPQDLPVDAVTTTEPAPDPAPRPDGTAPEPAPRDTGETVPETPSTTKPEVPPPSDGSPQPATDGPEPAGSLIPPDSSGALIPPEPPLGPPMHQTLREDDTSYAACLLALSHLGMSYTEEPPMTDPENRECGIARPIRVEAVLPGVVLDGGAVMRCDAARALGFWTRDFVRPAAAMLPGAPRLAGLTPGTTYDCRGRVGTGADAPKLSEHAYGNAIDIAAFRLDNGETLPVSPRQDSGDLPEAFQRTVRGAACLWFTTVLGPGSNASHDDHLHLDVIERGRGWRLCQ